ncbi:TlpA family protein disulfide reductase [Leadbetterella byssophila]|uniref:TlpA family protein disulfide reductase n=1 Tax=Leadbetterella byssophila TaxID=316068 RepID=UPI0039A22C19
MNAKICVMALLCHFLSSLAYAQALKVGDKIPDELWELPLQVVNHPEGRDTIRLGEYKDKLIILDFWATWCGACIKKFPETGRIQSQYFDQLAILGVTNDNKEKITTFTTRYRARDTARYIPPTTVNGQSLEKYFNFRIVPHYVWINRRGVIMAITSGEEVTPTNVSKFIDGIPFDFVAKQDQMDFDHSQPLYVNGNGGELVAGTFYRSLVTGPVLGLGKLLTLVPRDSSKVITRLRAINCEISDLVKLAHPEAARFPASRIISDSKITYQIRYTGHREGYKKWAEKNHISYELNLPPTPLYKASKFVASDLLRYWGLVADFEEREIDCMVITANKSISQSYTKGGDPSNNLRTSEEIRFMNNYSIHDFSSYLNDFQRKFYYINEAGDHPNLDIQFPENIEETQKLIDFMRGQGLDITPARRKIRVLVIKDQYE